MYSSSGSYSSPQDDVPNGGAPPSRRFRENAESLEVLKPAHFLKGSSYTKSLIFEKAASAEGSG
ncbi:uncharacterized protein LOC26526941 isoform X3 [Drosophila erecta]|uniref:uncharacterized protein LOC26526941 isoform X3 n=1 Tax=Drosophila erecta TaxID=7220 RepID=UPI000F05F481|nr:uncharacterized protein LOC26526941 isoform X3 [Drosophila erecta]